MLGSVVMQDDQDKSELESSWIETLRSSELSDIVKDVAELGLDSILSDGVLKDMPIVGWVVAVGKTAQTIREKFLIQKILKFFRGLSDISLNERQKFIAKIEEDRKYGNRVSEAIIIFLDRYDHAEKASILSKLFCSYARGEMDYTNFTRLATAVERAFMADLQDLLDHYSGNKSSTRRVERNLYACGLADFYVLTKEQQERGGLEHPQTYGFNQYAQQIAKAVLGEKYHQ
jgi:hypothetical protein